MQTPAWWSQAVRGPVDMAIDNLRDSPYALRVQARNPDHDPEKTGLRHGYRLGPRPKKRSWLTFAGLALTVILLLIWFFPSANTLPDRSFLESADNSYTIGPTQEAHLLYILIPTSKQDPDAELCKSVLTAEILQYPPPFVLYHENTTVSKLAQTQLRLERILAAHAKAQPLIILLDGPTHWFQLRPETLIERYYLTIGQENARHDRTGSSEISKVLFLADTECRGLSEDACSTLAKAARGPDQSQLVYPNAGMMIGPAVDLVPLVTRAHEMAMQRASSGAAQRADEYQHVMASVFVEQQKDREVSTFSRGPGLLQPTAEFGITLDSSNQIGLPISKDADHLAWRKHQRESMAVKDVAQTMRPFWTLDGYGVPLERTWHDVNLLTNDLTGKIPAVVSFDPAVSLPLLSQLQKTWWKKMWIHPFARKMYDYVALRPNMACARAYDHDGAAHSFWRVTNVMEKAGAHNYTGKWMDWNKICYGAALAENVFVDGQGEWINPAP